MKGNQKVKLNAKKIDFLGNVSVNSLLLILKTNQFQRILQKYVHGGCLSLSYSYVSVSWSWRTWVYHVTRTKLFYFLNKAGNRLSATKSYIYICYKNFVPVQNLHICQNTLGGTSLQNLETPQSTYTRKFSSHSPFLKVSIHSFCLNSTRPCCTFAWIQRDHVVLLSEKYTELPKRPHLPFHPHYWQPKLILGRWGIPK